MRVPRRLGLFGGSFNPLHHGHLLLARSAYEELGLDELWFIPCARSADGKPLAPGAQRLRWLKRALKDEPGFKVWDGELKRGGVSRSIDTVRALRALLGPRPELFVLIGQDQAARLKTWKESAALARAVRFAVFARPGLPPKKPAGFRLKRLHSPQIDLSSTEIRLRIKAKLPLTGMLPETIRRDNVLHKIYR